MGFWDRHDEQASNYDQQYRRNDDGGVEYHNEAETSHEVIGGAAAFAAMAMYEHKQKEEGKEVKHGFAKECVAAIAGWEADKLCETKGEDFIDKERARHEAKQRAEEMYDDSYGQNGETFRYDENNSYQGYQDRPVPRMDDRQQEFFDQYHN